MQDALKETFYRSKASLSVSVSEYTKTTQGGVESPPELRLRLSLARIIQGSRKIDKTSVQSMIFDTAEIFTLIQQINALIIGQINATETIVHESNSRISSIEIKKGKEYGFVLCMNANNSVTQIKDSFFISFSYNEIKYLHFMLSKILYYITTGSLNGYTISWI